MKESIKETTILNFPVTSAENMTKITKLLTPNKAIGSDPIPFKIFKTTAAVINSHFTYFLIKDITENKYLENAKTGMKLKTIDHLVF